MKTGTILIADDNKDILESLKQLLKYDFEIIIAVSNPEQIIDALKGFSIDLVLLDMNFTPGSTSGAEGMNWLKHILQIDPLAVVILITAYGDIDLAVKAIKQGGTDFIIKPWDPEKLLATVKSAYRLRQSRVEIKALKGTRSFLREDISKQFDPIIGTSPEIRNIHEVIRKASASDASILITGENGTGKELIAREIHRQSARAENEFIGLDIGSLNESLFESEMFGHIKGAFTDAKENRTGRIEAASGGTLFLDELGNLSMNLQSKLLRSLEERSITPVGSNTPIPVDLRLICATNHDLKGMIDTNTFREDLYYRINTIEINIPPLRERISDIPALFDYFLRKYEKKYVLPPFQVTGEAYAALQEYRWPGNVRELKHLVEKIVILNESGIIKTEDLSPPDQRSTVSGKDEFLDLAELERNALMKALKLSQGNLSRAARLLNISRTTLYSKLQKHGL